MSNSFSYFDFIDKKFEKENIYGLTFQQIHSILSIAWNNNIKTEEVMDMIISSYKQARSDISNAIETTKKNIEDIRWESIKQSRKEKHHNWNKKSFYD